MADIWFFVIIIILYLISLLFKSIRDFNYRYLSEILTAIGGIGLTICDIMSDSEEIFSGEQEWKDVWPYLFIFFSVILLVAIIISAKRNKLNRTIEQEIDRNKDLIKEIKTYKSEYYKLCSNIILSLFKNFYTNSERVSIYKFNGNHFILLGRFSRNQNFNIRTDYKYSPHEGLIGKGWDEGSVYVCGAPKWEKKNKKSYNDFMKKNCNIADKRLDAITMKSRSIYVVTINDESTAENPDGIIVFESIMPDRVTKEECDEIINDKKSDILKLLQNMKSLTEKTHQ